MESMKRHWLLDLQVFYRRINLDGSLNHDDTQYTYTYLMVNTSKYNPEDYKWRMYIHSLCQDQLNKLINNCVITYIICIAAIDLSVISSERPQFHNDYLYDITFDCNDLYESTFIEELSKVE